MLSIMFFAASPVYPAMRGSKISKNSLSFSAFSPDAISLNGTENFFPVSALYALMNFLASSSVIPSSAKKFVGVYFSGGIVVGAAVALAALASSAFLATAAARSSGVMDSSDISSTRALCSSRRVSIVNLGPRLPSFSGSFTASSASAISCSLAAMRLGKSASRFCSSCSLSAASCAALTRASSAALASSCRPISPRSRRREPTPPTAPNAPPATAPRTPLSIKRSNSSEPHASCVSPTMRSA